MSAVDAERSSRGLGWAALTDVLWDQPRESNTDLAYNCLRSGALVRTARRGTMSCQYALILLSWIGKAPEEFLTGLVVVVGDTALPRAGLDRRLRFDLPGLHAALNRERQERGLTWSALGEVLGCAPARLTNLRTARLADMDLTMCDTQWLARPAVDFVHPAGW